MERPTATAYAGSATPVGRNQKTGTASTGSRRRRWHGSGNTPVRDTSWSTATLYWCDMQFMCFAPWQFARM